MKSESLAQAVGDLRPTLLRLAPDEHMLALCDLLVGAELMKDLGLMMALREGYGRMRGAEVEASVPEDIHVISTVLRMYMASRLD